MTTRLAAIVALLTAFVVVVVVFFTGSESYTVNVRIVDSGQLVKGGLVQVAGRSVGTVKEITLADDGVANVQIEITDEKYQPLNRGTIARIRTIGLTGVANRFVELEPGPDSGEDIPDRGVMSTAESRPIIDLDVLFNSLDPETRDRLQRIIRNGGKIFDGTTASANTAFGYLAPALAQSEALLSELARDKASMERLITAGATTSSALAAERSDISQGISSTAVTLRALAAERESLAEIFERAPEILENPDRVLGGVRDTLSRARPALREARPVTPRLATVLRKLVPTAREARPVLVQTRRLLPALNDDLRKLPAVADVGVPSLRSLTETVIALMPVVDGLRPYTPDLAAGLLTGLGRSAGLYDANGGYGRIALQGGSTALTGLLGGLTGPGAVNEAGVRTGLDARCAGAATEPAADESNPFIENSDNCNPDHTKRP